tara:strand:+ start:87 stop:290 length:204 start_codon:yes stop_codon:yes gene_type:complete
MKAILNKHEYAEFVRYVDYLKIDHDFEIHYSVTILDNAENFEVKLLNITEEDMLKDLDNLLDTRLEK